MPFTYSHPVRDPGALGLFPISYLLIPKSLSAHRVGRRQVVRAGWRQRPRGLAIARQRDPQARRHDLRRRRDRRPLWRCRAPGIVQLRHARTAAACLGHAGRPLARAMRPLPSWIGAATPWTRTVSRSAPSAGRVSMRMTRTCVRMAASSTACVRPTFAPPLRSPPDASSAHASAHGRLRMSADAIRTAGLEPSAHHTSWHGHGHTAPTMRT